MVNSRQLQSEYKLCIEAAGWAEVPIGVLRVIGRDRTSWLNKIITTNVAGLTEGQGARAALLNANGHFESDFILLGDNEAVLMLVPPDSKDHLSEALRRYIIREKVRILDESTEWILVTMIGTQSDALAQASCGAQVPSALHSYSRVDLSGQPSFLIRTARARLASTDVLLKREVANQIIPKLDPNRLLSSETLEILRVEAGIPSWGIDFDANTLALEIPDVISIRVDQGCYVGQEVVARLVHRGHVNRLLVGIEIVDGHVPAAGAKIIDQSKDVGYITSAVLSPQYGALGLGYVRRESAAPGTRVQIANAGEAVVAKLPFGTRSVVART